MGYIEREAAFNAILKLVPKVDGNGSCWVIRGVAAVAIDNIPASDVRPVVRGHWIDGTCSNCGFFTDVVMSRFFSYCPNCGADMQEPLREE
jgi:hypothetical protein